MLCNYTLWRDRNGNKALRITPANGRERGFSIQTNGNLSRTHRDGITDDTPGKAKGAY